MYQTKLNQDMFPRGRKEREKQRKKISKKYHG